MGDTDDGIELEAWLDQTADVLAGRGALWAICAGWTPAPQSYAEWEQHEAESVGWGDGRPPLVVQAALLDWWDGSDGFLGAIEALFRTRQVTHGVPYLCRAVLEHSHKICWLLEARQTVDGVARPVTLVDRAARVYLEELYSHRHRSDTVKKIARDDRPAIATAKAEYRELRATTIPALFKDVALDGEPRAWSINGQKWRGPTWLADWYARTRGGGSNGAYDALSAMSHPTLYGIREFIEYEPVGDQMRRRRTIPKDFLLRVTGGALVTHWRACMDLASYFGWDRSALDEWAAAINDWRPGSIAPHTT